MRTASPFGRAGEFFGAAFNDMERASDMQARIQGTGVADARYGADYDGSYMSGAVAPQSGPYGQDDGPAYDTESLKRELLAIAKERRPSDGSVIMRAGGGGNPAVKQ